MRRSNTETSKKVPSIGHLPSPSETLKVSSLPQRIQRALADPTAQNLTPEVRQALQRTHGNQFVMRAINRNVSSDSHKSASKPRITQSTQSQGVIQRELKTIEKHMIRWKVKAAIEKAQRLYTENEDSWDDVENLMNSFKDEEQAYAWSYFVELSRSDLYSNKVTKEKIAENARYYKPNSRIDTQVRKLNNTYGKLPLKGVLDLYNKRSKERNWDRATEEEIQQALQDQEFGGMSVSQYTAISGNLGWLTNQVSVGEVQQISENQFNQLKIGLKGVTEEQDWDTIAPSEGGIYTTEMAPCISIIVKGYKEDQLYSVLWHSFREVKPKNIATNIQLMQTTLAKTAGVSLEELKNVEYYVIGGDYTSMGKAIDILSVFKELGLKLSGVQLTTNPSEASLVKGAIVTTNGEVRYIAKERN